MTNLLFKWLSEKFQKLNYSVQRIPLKEKIFFTQNLYVMIKTGLSLATALKTISSQTENKKFRSILNDIRSQIEKGENFSKSLTKYKKIFGELFISMVASGEVSGNLESVLQELTLQMKRDHELISKVKGAMIYPTIVILAMIGIGAVMIVYVIPNITSIFKELNAELPLPTRILIGISDFVIANGFFVLVALTILIVSVWQFGRTKHGKAVYHWLMLHMLILGNIVKKIQLARFARTLSSLLKTDIPIVQSIEITANTLGNVYYKQALIVSSEKLKKGASINSVIANYPKLFPPVVTQMVHVGEESGSLDNTLKELASFYEEEVDQIMKNLPTIIEPLIILLLGLGVGGMAVSVLMPMYSLTQAF